MGFPKRYFVLAIYFLEGTVTIFDQPMLQKV